MKYAVAWLEFDRNNRLIAKRKDFHTEKAMDRFVFRLMAKDNFYQILAYS